MSVFLVFLTILVSGFAGGVGGAFLRDEFKKRDEGTDGEIVETTDWWALRRYVILGMLAAFVVPLFLVLASPGNNEGLIRKLTDPATVSAEWWNHLLVLIGFCIIAALSAPSFLRTLSERVLNQAKVDAEVARTVSEEARKLADKARKKAETAEDMAEALEHGGIDQPFSREAMNALNAIATVPSITPTTEEIAEAIREPLETTADLLGELRDSGFIWEGDDTAEDPGWRLRGWGKQRLHKEGTLKPKERKVLEALNKEAGQTSKCRSNRSSGRSRIFKSSVHTDQAGEDRSGGTQQTSSGRMEHSALGSRSTHGTGRRRVTCRHEHRLVMASPSDATTTADRRPVVRIELGCVGDNRSGRSTHVRCYFRTGEFAAVYVSLTEHRVRKTIIEINFKAEITTGIKACELKRHLLTTVVGPGKPLKPDCPVAPRISGEGLIHGDPVASGIRCRRTVARETRRDQSQATSTTSRERFG